MLGLAQRMFIEKSSRNLWRETKAKSSLWPSLDKLLATQQLSYVDLALAQHLLQKSGTSSEAFAALICHLSAAARLGHLCVRLENNSLVPSLEQVWLASNETEPVDAASLKAIEQLIIENIDSFPSSLINDQDDKDTVSSSLTPICKWRSFYYLQRYWMLESKFLKHFTSFFSDSVPKLVLDSSKVQGTINTLLSEHKLVPEQASAIVQACQQAFTIITGGPGTGKTYTAGLFLKLLWEHLSPTQRQECRIELAAPTGKAAANLEASIQRSLAGVEGFPDLTAKTLHSLLRKKGQNRVSITFLNADILLIDESSMIDVRLMGDLFAALKPGARVILLGDRYQLPPVEAGSLFTDLVTYLQKEPQTSKHVIELKTCLRTESTSIIGMAEKVKQKDTEGMLQLLKDSKDPSLRYVPLKETQGPKEWQSQLLTQALPHFSSIKWQKETPLSILKAFLRFRILTPRRQGPLGSEALNKLFFEAMHSQASIEEPLVIPIMITQNYQRLDLFNGEVGLLITFPENSSNNFALFSSTNTGEVSQIPALLLPKYEYAYCISIHKSQGSEFEHVLMILPEGMETFGREALYTGMTRARHCLEIWSSEKVLSSMLEKISQRCSGVIKRLLEN